MAKTPKLTRAQKQQNKFNDAVAAALKAAGFAPGAAPTPAPSPAPTPGLFTPEQIAEAKKKKAEADAARAAERAKKATTVAALHESANRHRRAAKPDDTDEAKARRDVVVKALQDTAHELEAELERDEA